MSEQLLIMGEENFNLAQEVGQQQNPPISFMVKRRDTDTVTGMTTVYASAQGLTPQFWNQLKSRQDTIPSKAFQTPPNNGSYSIEPIDMYD